MDERIPDNRVESVAVAARRLLHEGSITDLTLRNLAVYVGCSPSTLVQRFNSKRIMMAHVVAWLGRSWLDCLHREVHAGPEGLLGNYETWSVDHLRGWLAMCELGRGDDHLALEVAHIELEQRRLLERVLPYGTDLATRDAWVALIRGLHHELAARSGPLSVERARAAIDAFARVLSDPDASRPRSA